MFRKRKATPGFGRVPYNPIHGEQANLLQEGTHPFCAMMQIAAEDVSSDYVVCRGFDTRILKFVDYDAFDPTKNGISVAKPFGKRVVGTYQIGEIYPAFLPTQGNDGSDFRKVTYVPPSPSDVLWRVGQNPGVVSGGLTGGQPADLSEEIGILYDDSGNVINWMLIDSSSACSERLEKFEMLSDWVGTTGLALAAFTLIEETVPDMYGIVEDPCLIFEDQLSYGQKGLSIRTCSGRHFVIQAKCNQTVIVPPDPQGACSYSGDDGTTCAQTSEADCTLLGGSWADGDPCP